MPGPRTGTAWNPQRAPTTGAPATAETPETERSRNAPQGPPVTQSTAAAVPYLGPSTHDAMDTGREGSASGRHHDGDLGRRTSRAQPRHPERTDDPTAVHPQPGPLRHAYGASPQQRGDG